MAWQIVKHAFQMIFNNFGQAVRVSLVPMILLMVAWGVLLSVSGVPISAIGAEQNPEELGNVGLLSLLLILAGLVFTMFVASWVAVAWHRFILLEEYSGYLPATAERPIWGYVGKSALLAVILAVAAIPLSFIVGFMTAGFLNASGQIPTPVAVIAGLALGTVMGFLWFRMAICLPAKAIGKDMTFGQAWSATARLSGTIFGMTVIIVALNIGVGVILGALFGGIPLISTVFEIAINWLSTMVGICVLTTLYGHLVEGRPLVD